MGDYKDFKKLHPNARKSIIIGDAAVSAIVIGIATAARLIIFALGIPEGVVFWINAIYILIIVLSLAILILDSTIGYAHKKYRINEESIEYIKGIFFLQHTIIPIRRMQQVDIEEGPINRMFKLAEVNLVTAGGDLTIELLEKEKAEKIVSELKALINKFAIEQSKIIAQEKAQLIEKDDVKPVQEEIENGKQ